MSDRPDPNKPEDARTKEGNDWGWNVLPQVFYPSAAIILGMVVLTVTFQTRFEGLFGHVQAQIANTSGWFYVLTMNLVLVTVLFLLCSRFGAIRLGGQAAVPEFTMLGWIAMLFSAGMGIGLLFYGVAEPLYHGAIRPPLAESYTVEAAQQAMGFTFLHWGLHPWGVYAIVGLALAFFSYNRGAPLSIRAVFYPILGERIHAWPGHVIDVLATVATMFGVATSLGLGVKQVNAGLNHLFGLPDNGTVQVVLIAIITAMATVSVVKGLDGGIRRLSELNISLALLLLTFVFILGPTLFLLNGMVENVGYYLQNLPRLATWSETYENTSWQNGWTVFYWGWWIAWSPFVGMFIARVSRGRTIREFLICVLLIPSSVTFVWMTVFGNTALQIEMLGAGGMAAAVQENVPVALFKLLENFPLSGITCFLAVLVIISFFVTSSDSGSMVIDIITAGGDPEPPVPQRIFWAVTEGVVAAALLYGGGLVALQAAAISTGLPFSLVLVVMCVSLIVALRRYYPDSYTSSADLPDDPADVTPEPTSGVPAALSGRARAGIAAALVLIVALVAAKWAHQPAETAVRPAFKEGIVQIAATNWSSSVASSNLVRAVLQERLGYRCRISTTGIEEVWRSVAGGEQDLTTSAWLPDTHAPYFERFADRVDVLDPFLQGTRLGLVVPVATTGRQTGESGQNVPLDVPVRSIADLPDYASEFGGRIVGIDAQAGITIRARRMLDAYGLNGYELIEGTEATMTARIAQSLRDEQWILFTGWTPHWMTSRWSLRFLEDPQNVFGGEGNIHAVVRRGFERDYAEVHAFLQRFRLEPDQLSQLMNWNEHRGASPYENARRWIRTHPEEVGRWLGES